MEKEKKGLFGRLLDFWRGKISMRETDSIGFWNDAENVENHFAEMGAVAALSQQEMKKAFWEEGFVSEKKQKESGILEIQKKIYFAEPEEREEETQKILLKTEKDEKKGNFFAMGDFREEPEKVGLGEPFLWEKPAEEQEKRSIIPVAAELMQEKETGAEELQGMPRNEISKKEEAQAEPVIDIEKLMRQMTKKLWEERESCGRRLR